MVGSHAQHTDGWVWWKVTSLPKKLLKCPSQLWIESSSLQQSVSFEHVKLAQREVLWSLSEIIGCSNLLNFSSQLVETEISRQKAWLELQSSCFDHDVPEIKNRFTVLPCASVVLLEGCPCLAAVTCVSRKGLSALRQLCMSRLLALSLPLLLTSPGPAPAQR